MVCLKGKTVIFLARIQIILYKWHFFHQNFRCCRILTVCKLRSKRSNLVKTSFLGLWSKEAKTYRPKKFCNFLACNVIPLWILGLLWSLSLSSVMTLLCCVQFRFEQTAMILQYMFGNYTKHNSTAFSKNNSPVYKECINHLSNKSGTEIFLLWIVLSTFWTNTDRNTKRSANNTSINETEKLSLRLNAFYTLYLTSWKRLPTQ